MTGLEAQTDRPNRAVAMLGNDDVSGAFRLQVLWVIQLLSVDEEHHIGIVLDRTAFW